MKLIAQNKKATYEYEILNEYEAGIVLLGSEVKSLRSGKANIQEGYIDIDKNEEVYILNMNIPVYQNSSKYFNHKPTRKRKLLLSKKEINKLLGSVKIKGLTIIPLSLYFNSKNFVKIKIALAKGKKIYDKRESIKKKDINRDIEISTKKYLK